MPVPTLFLPALALVFALLAGSGCELIVDFDRSKIPMAGSDAPGPDGSMPPDDDAGADEDAGD